MAMSNRFKWPWPFEPSHDMAIRIASLSSNSNGLAMACDAMAIACDAMASRSHGMASHAMAIRFDSNDMAFKSKGHGMASHAMAIRFESNAMACDVAMSSIECHGHAM